MIHSPRRSDLAVGLAFLVAILLICGVGVISYRSLSTILNAYEWEVHTHVVLVELERENGLLREAENARRGFTLTGDEARAEEFSRAAEGVRGALRELRQLTSDNPGQQRTLADLATLVEHRLVLLSESVELRRWDPAQVEAQIASTREGVAQDEPIRRQLDEMILGEKALLEERHARGGQDAAQSGRIVLFSTALAVLTLVGAGVLLLRTSTARREADAKLVSERALLDSVIQGMGDGLVSADKGGHFLLFNPAAERILGARKLATSPETWARDYRLYRADGATPFPPEEVPLARALRGESSDGIDMYVSRPDRGVWISVSARPLRDAAGAVTGAVAVFSDVTERKHSGERLRESEERYRVLFDASPMPMWAFDTESLGIAMANQAAADQYGYTTVELATLSLTDVRPPEEVEKIRAAARNMPTGRSYCGTWKHQRKNGSRLDVDVHVNDVRLGGQALRLAVLHDVTQRRSLEEQLRQSQKMEAVGRLAGGVAHDFNNLLTAILGYSDLLSSRFHAGDAELAEIQEIRRAGERAAALTRQLLVLSRKQVLVPEALDLGSVVGSLSRLLERLIGEEIKVSLVVAPDLGRVLADPGQMEQVVMNLALNARDAMPRGGELRLEIKNVDLDDAFASEHIGVTPGPHVLLTVTDSGVGMASEVQKQIFEPFFTTKKSGEGTGLGLATVHGIVSQSSGTIWVDSEPGRGTTFKIYLPRITGALAAPKMASGIFPALAASGTILLVEDEKQLRELARRILELGGYTVLDARNSADALRVAREHDGPINLLLTDVVMPGMSGPELAASLLIERPDVSVLYMSGYTNDAIAHHGVLNPGTQFIQKPFVPRKLVERVREVIRGTR